MSERSPFLTFRRFKNTEDLKELIHTLDKEGVYYLVEDASPVADVTFAGNDFDKEFHLKIKSSDFQRVEELLLDSIQINKNDFPEDYYLFQFTNEELIEILLKPDEWSPVDFKLSQFLLEERGKKIDQEFIDVLRKQRNDELAKPEENPRTWIFAGYLFGMLGGFLGIFIGWHLLVFKKTLPDGRRVFGYKKSDRRHGRNILIIGVLMSSLWLLVRWYE